LSALFRKKLKKAKCAPPPKAGGAPGKGNPVLSTITPFTANPP